LPGDALVKREARVRLGDEFPVRHRLGIITPGGWSAGRSDRKWRGGLADLGEDPLHRGGLGHECHYAHMRPAARTREQRNPILPIGSPESR
jgi:hypothetical protein